jgi:hypothetical protein
MPCQINTATLEVMLAASKHPTAYRHTPKTHLQHGDVSACQLRPLLVKVVSVLEEPVAVALVKQVPVAASILLKLGCVV